ncbi:MAG: class I SAM-dependent methyltransferase [Actinobacteria bacterium]|nr:class I SAM-dependent methyltransferase [Actinomycetota bacterium]
MTAPRWLARVRQSARASWRAWRANRQRRQGDSDRYVGRFSIDYPVRPRPRWGHGSPPHPRLSEIIGRNRTQYAATLQGVTEHQARLCAIPMHAPKDSPEPRWINGALPGLDAAVLYSFVADKRPATYLEVGSGHSTKFARRACTDHDLATRIVSIDPAPHTEIDALCDEVIRAGLEDVDLAIFDRLDGGDILFVDNSHRCFQNSDVTVAFLDVLPRLRPGVLVHFHDIFLPDDYPPAIVHQLYSEQYVLAAILLAEGLKLEIALPAWFVSSDAELAAILEPLWSQPGFEGVQRHGASFWLRTGPAA